MLYIKVQIKVLPVLKRHLRFTPEFLKTDYDYVYGEFLRITQTLLHPYTLWIQLLYALKIWRMIMRLHWHFLNVQTVPNIFCVWARTNPQIYLWEESQLNQGMLSKVKILGILGSELRDRNQLHIIILTTDLPQVNLISMYKTVRSRLSWLECCYKNEFSCCDGQIWIIQLFIQELNFLSNLSVSGNVKPNQFQ